jgi:hypothetical protein
VVRDETRDDNRCSSVRGTAPTYAWLGAGELSSELLSTGVVTTGASSYVPEIGPAIQTGPVASPSAFPDGTGGAGVVQANYVEALTEQLKAIAVEHEAALEAAAQLGRKKSNEKKNGWNRHLLGKAITAKSTV